VGTRARPFDLSIARGGEAVIVKCSHDGYRYLPGKPNHRREWRFVPGSVTVEDSLDATAEARSYWYLGAEVALSGEGLFLGKLPGGQSFTITGGVGSWARTASTLHPEFGSSVPATLLLGELSGARGHAHLAWA
jgi:hypothetical protein